MISRLNISKLPSHKGIMNQQHWWYAINPQAPYHLIDSSSGRQMPASAETILKVVYDQCDDLEDFPLKSGFRAMKKGDHLWLYAGGSSQQIFAYGIVHEVDDRNADDRRVRFAYDYELVKALQTDLIRRSDLGLRAPQSVRRITAQPAVAILNQFLAKHAHADPWSPVPEPQSELDGRQRVMRSIVQRQGQPAFRRELLSAYGRRCAITGCDIEQLLDAAHISPYLGTHTNEVGNGILLRTDLHLLFDRHLLGIRPDYTILVAKALKGTDHYGDLDGKLIRVPRRRAERPRTDLLERRLEQVNT